MSVRQNKPVSRLDGGPWLSARTTVRQDFLKFSRRNLSCIRTSSWGDGSIVRKDARPLQVISITGFAPPDQGAGAFGRLNFSTQFPYLMRVRPDHKGETSGRLKSNRQLPYTMHQRPDHSCQMSGQFILNYDSCLTEIRIRTVYHIVQTVDWSFLGKNQWTVRELIGVQTCCWNVWTEQDGTEASRYSEVSGRKKHVVRTDDDGLSGVRTADRELWISPDFSLNSGIPVCSILTYMWFCPNTEWGQNTNKIQYRILTILNPRVLYL
jgi:hypothetical protein